MVRDKKAEALESRGLFRRAASRWLDVMELHVSAEKREWIKQRLDFCIMKAKRKVLKCEVYSDIKQDIKNAHERLGFDKKNGEAFRGRK